MVLRLGVVVGGSGGTARVLRIYARHGGLDNIGSNLLCRLILRA